MSKDEFALFIGGIIFGAMIVLFGVMLSNCVDCFV